MIRNLTRPPRSPLEVIADVVRVLGLVSVVVAAIGWTVTDAGVLAFTLPGLLIPRLLALRPSLDIFACLVMLAAAWSNVLDLYTSIAWWDLVIHFVCTGVLAALAFLGAVAWGAVRGPQDPGFGRGKAVVMTIVLGLALSAVWEMVEWAGHTFISDEIFVAYEDTIGDMAIGALGAGVAGLFVGSVRVQREPESTAFRGTPAGRRDSGRRDAGRRD